MGTRWLRFAALAALALTTSACNRSQQSEQPRERSLTGVEVLRLGSASDQIEVNGIGTVQFDQEVVLSFPASGIIAAILVEEGAAVQAGQVVARIQTATANADLRAARADALRSAQARRRIETLYRRGFATRAQLEAAQAGDAAAQARTEQARFVASNAVLRAARSGRVLARLAEVGQVVQPGTPVIRMGENGAGLIARLAFPDSSAIAPGTPVDLFAGQGASETRQPATVRRILPLRNAATGTLVAEVAVPAGPTFAAGVIVRGRARVPGQGNLVLLPLSALVDGRTDQASVYAVDADSRVRRRDVTFDGLRGNDIAVTDGLMPGERIIVRGVPYVRPGEQVRIAREVVGTWSD